MKMSKLLFCVALISFSICSYAGTSVTMIADVPYAEGSRVKANIRKECLKLGTKLASFTQEFSKKQNIDVQLAESIDTSASGRVLQLEITDAVSRGNAFIGHRKFVDVKGILWEDGKKVASFTATRVSGGGFAGGYKSSCAVLGRCVKAIGKDIASWLANPEDDVHLGD